MTIVKAKRYDQGSKGLMAEIERKMRVMKKNAVEGFDNWWYKFMGMKVKVLYLLETIIFGCLRSILAG